MSLSLRFCDVAHFISSLAVGGFDLKKMINERGTDGSMNGEPIVDVTARDGTGDRVQIFIE